MLRPLHLQYLLKVRLHLSGAWLFRRVGSEFMIIEGRTSPQVDPMLLSSAGSPWRIAGTGDFNGDDAAELVLETQPPVRAKFFEREISRAAA